LADHLGDIKGKLSKKEKEAISAGFHARFTDIADPEVLEKADEVCLFSNSGGVAVWQSYIILYSGMLLRYVLFEVNMTTAFLSLMSSWP
jgi:hypothetical protein